MNDQIYTSPFQGYDAGVQGLAQLGRNAIDRVSELERGIAERDETIRQLRARAVNAEADNGQLTQGATLSPKERIEFGKLVVRLGVRNVIARLRERDELRAQLDEYERAPTVAKTHGEYGDRIMYLYPFSDKYPPVGTELIARPARKE